MGRDQGDQQGTEELMVWLEAGRCEGTTTTSKATSRLIGHLTGAPRGDELPGRREINDLFRRSQALLLGRV